MATSLSQHLGTTGNYQTDLDAYTWAKTKELRQNNPNASEYTPTASEIGQAIKHYDKTPKGVGAKIGGATASGFSGLAKIVGTTFGENEAVGKDAPTPRRQQRLWSSSLVSRLSL